MSTASSAANATPQPLWRKRSSRADLAVFIIWVLALAFVSWSFQVMTQDTI